jgi:hypothetical protein
MRVPRYNGTEDEFKNQSSENFLLIGNKAEGLANVIAQCRTNLRGRLELPNQEGETPEQA